GAIAIATLFVEDAVIFHDGAFEIAEQREGYAVLFGEFLVGGNAVYAETKNLGIGRFEFGDISLIRLHFLRSTTGESQNIKRQHHVLLPLKVTELKTHAPAVGAYRRARQGEVRRRLAYFQVRMRRGR